MLAAGPALARDVPKTLPYPAKGADLTAQDVAEQVYFVNHFYAFKNFGIARPSKTKITVIVNRVKNRKPKTLTVERYINNNYPEGDKIKSRDIAFFRSGKLKGTGLLITDYAEVGKSQSYMIWLPALRKIRRFAEPAHDDAWGGTTFTFGDVTLRKPDHETHELDGKAKFDGCLGYIDMPSSQRNRYTKNLATSPTCRHDGKTVYKLKSTTKRENWWYDYRVSFVDTKTFADYRTDYYKGGKKIKTIDRDWGVLEGQAIDDPRGMTWRSWYGKDDVSGTETWAVIPDETVVINEDKDNKFWSPKTLTKLKR
ncbi:MAG: outer membrane lipoprotein-sorting protein [Gammaproteobacteria bacterium]|nr:MAG: outer membrane lipoprotein-sorting protein [Gammaproteobacteria bacterium]